MNKNQKKAFWMMFLGFCITGTAAIYPQGAFNFTGSIVGALILAAFYLIVAIFIYFYVKSNAEKIDEWFNK